MKLVSLGRRTEPQSLSGLLLECHSRIRGFIRIAVDVGRRPDLAVSDVVDACTRCTRYFTVALPLHVEDEELSLVPRLAGLEPELDAALAAMRAQHEQHEPKLRALLIALARVETDPSDLPARASLKDVASDLEAEFEAHLQLEESGIFPAIDRHLSAEIQLAALTELRARRA